MYITKLQNYRKKQYTYNFSGPLPSHAENFLRGYVFSERNFVIL